MNRILCGCLLWAGLSLGVGAQEEAPKPPAEKPKLRVAVHVAPPFVFGGEKPYGYDVELWQRVAREAGYTAEITPVNSVPEVLDRLRNKQLDVGLGAISITSEREATIDFSHPYYDSGLQIMTRRNQSMSIFGAIRAVGGDLLKIAGILLVALLVNAHLLWWLERRRNPENFPESYPHGVWEAGWWSVCTLITGGCENISPAAVPGRLLAIVWMLAGIGLVSFVTAKMASIMTVNTLISEVQKISDLRGTHVGTMRGTTAQLALEKESVRLHTYASVEEAAAALAKKEVDAVVYDAPVLKYYLIQNPKAEFHLVGAMFEKQRYGLALQQSSPFRKEINRVLLKLQEETFLEGLDRRWFPPLDSGTTAP